MVWLSKKNIIITRPIQNFDYRQFGPHKILKIVGESRLAFNLELNWEGYLPSERTWEPASHVEHAHEAIPIPLVHHWRT